MSPLNLQDSSKKAVRQKARAKKSTRGSGRSCHKCALAVHALQQILSRAMYAPIRQSSIVLAARGWDPAGCSMIPTVIHPGTHLMMAAKPLEL